MSNNPIRKMHVGWENHWIGSGTRTDFPVSVRQWVFVCPKCKVVRRVKPNYHPYGTGKITRKAAKDALHYHMKTFH